MPPSEPTSEEQSAPSASDGVPPDQTSLTPDFPTYKAVRHFMRTVDGTSYWLYRSMVNRIWEARGNPQEQADWANPEQWIPQLLTGDEQKLALRFWNGSGKTLNPRYLRGPWYLSSRPRVAGAQWRRDPADHGARPVVSR